MDVEDRTIAFVCADRWGREIILYEDTWYDHVMENHRTLAGRLDEVEAAIVRAETVTHDRSQHDRECFYRNGDLPPPDQDDFVKVVVEFGAGPDGVVRGTVVTAYPIVAVERRERRRW